MPRSARPDDRRGFIRATLGAYLILVTGAVLPDSSHAVVTWEELARKPVPPADGRIQYGDDPRIQFGEMRLPERAGPYPVAIVIHGGCWSSKYNYRHITGLSAALTRSGIATWTIEYRRIGDPGGGWSGTFTDVATATDYLRTLAQQYSLDLFRVITVGHSSGGQLALWLAARNKLPPDSPLSKTDPLPLKGVVTLDGITDLRKFGSGPEGCNKAVAALLGGKPSTVPNRYSQASPIELLPLVVPQILVHGTRDPIVPVEQSWKYAASARKKGDDAQAWILKGAGHFDAIAPFSPAWETVERAVHTLLAD